VLELVFRQYIVDVIGIMSMTRLILEKAKERAVVSDEPVVPSE